MDETTRANLANIHSPDPETQNRAYYDLIAASEQPVDWSYEAWNGLLADLKDPNNRVRSIASQLLANLAKSDPENRMLADFDALLDVTRDERFVTARHCLQAIWKVGLAGPAQRQKLLDGLALRFRECISEKNGSLIRSDILQDLRSLHAQTGDESIRALALALIETEEDPKYRQKYASIWRKR